MAPGGDRLPAAESEVAVASRLGRHVRGLPRPTATAIRLAMRAFDWTTFPRRFSRLGDEARERALTRLAASRSPLRRELLLLMKTLALVAYASDERVRIAVGYEVRCAVDDGDRADEASSDSTKDAGDSLQRPTAGSRIGALGELRAQGSGEDCDVAIVGSGAGGAAAAAILAEAGLDVLVLEAGPYLTANTYPDDPLEALSALYRDRGLTIAAGRPAVPVPTGRAVGGTTVVNSGTCFRAPERVLRQWRDELGIGWAGELDGEYAEAEERLSVTELDENRIGRNGQLVAEGARALGASGGPISRNAARCHQCSSCPQGCRLDAKQAMHLTYLPRAVAAGARVRAGVEVERILFRHNRATGLTCRLEDNRGRGVPARGYEVRARKAVIAAGGAFGTPELLLRSGVRHRELGRNLRIHPAAWVGARFDEPVRGWDGVMQSYYVDEWQEQGVMLEATFTPLAFGAHWLPGVGLEHQERMLAFDRLGSNGVHLSDQSTGRVRLASDGSPRISYRLRADDARRLAFGIARAAELWFAAGATEVYPQLAGNPVLRPAELATFEARPPKRQHMRIEAFHPMGTARIGPDQAHGVTDADGAVHGTASLYVADASLLPSSLGVNPMMTIIATAATIARRLAERLG